MKLREKIIMITILPVIIIGVCTIVMLNNQVGKLVFGERRVALEAAVTRFVSHMQMDSDGQYNLDATGELCKGEIPISYYEEALDELKAKTGVDTTVFFGDTRYVTSILNEEGTKAIGTQASQEIIQEVLEDGKSIMRENVDVNGEPYFAYYEPLFNQNGDKPVGMVFAGSSQVSIDKEKADFLSMIIIFIVIIGLMGLFVAIICVYFITKSLKEVVSVVEQMSQGNLQVHSKEKNLKRRDEVGQLSRSIDELLGGLVGILGGIKDQSITLSESSNELSKIAVNTLCTMEKVEESVTDSAKGAVIQAEETETVSKDVIFMGNMIHSTAEVVCKLHSNAEIMMEYTDSASKILGELSEIGIKSKESIEEIYKQIIITNESTKGIEIAIGLIGTIATETNLLSLNASIEAARAGNEGRGFAVVATQISKLAEQSNKSTRQIESMVTTLKKESAGAVETMEEVKAIMEKQDIYINKTEKLFEEVIKGIGESVDGVNVITISTDKLDSARANVVGVVGNLTAAAQENAAGQEETASAVLHVVGSMEEVSKSAIMLKSISENLNDSLSIFTI